MNFKAAPQGAMNIYHYFLFWLSYKKIHISKETKMNELLSRT